MAVRTNPIRLGYRRRLLGVWLLAAVGITVGILIAHSADGPLDDPDLARQRAGYLDSVGDRTPAPPVLAGVPRQGDRSVVFFIRCEQAGRLASAFTSDPLPTGVAAVAVLPDGSCPAALTGATIVGSGLSGVVAPDLARAYGMPTPRDGGPPVGYAVVGPDGTVRYRTLDPGVGHRMSEVRTVLRALS